MTLFVLILSRLAIAKSMAKMAKYHFRLKVPVKCSYSETN